MAANGSIVLSRKQKIVSSLCKHLSLDPKILLDDVMEKDIKSLYFNVRKSSGASLDDNHEVMKWIELAESLPLDFKSCSGVLNKLDDELALKSVLLGNGLKPSEVDVIVFSVLHPLLVGLQNEDKDKLPHVMRWMDYIQSKEDFGELFEKILLEKAKFKPQLEGAKNPVKVDVDSDAKKTLQSAKNADKLDADLNLKKSDTGATGVKEAAQEKKKSSETEAVEKDKEISVSLLNIQVGVIRKAWKHPSADSLLVEEIDIGDAKLRQVVSGLAKYYSPDELTNRRVVLITNVKPGKLRDVMSEGLVLCASNEDHTIVEPLFPPEEAKLGERVSFAGIDGKPEDVLNPKKKHLEKITPHLFTDDKGVATFKGIPFMTSCGPCTSAIPKASIK
ncbi:aminoacyl tRNA synthase complex-interacting multifunctional protein 1 isoform X2 [Juglans microcarpa x Juglans regia]|uniref:aminoacyl tRNA synthase complex-interacting multifunctional protein 1 isoform X2 n=1 Tax=Juglans microcarpa x Juglans regia TaxID=2249226 RepID=UPI001B7F4F21|nr:aminoacyl tRNA synthase complex-interacting multifunctional protein 1 isoform X2 [Juglans microcarpa x Juglans regia]